MRETDDEMHRKFLLRIAMKELEQKIDDLLSTPFASYRPFAPNEKVETIGIVIGLVYPSETIVNQVIPNEDWLDSEDIYDHDENAARQRVRLSDNATAYLKVVIARGENIRVEKYEIPNFWAILKPSGLVKEVPTLSIVVNDSSVRASGDSSGSGS